MQLGLSTPWWKVNDYPLAKYSKHKTPRVNSLVNMQIERLFYVRTFVNFHSRGVRNARKSRRAHFPATSRTNRLILIVLYEPGICFDWMTSQGQ
jgi:hypothetical protein